MEPLVVVMLQGAPLGQEGTDTRPLTVWVENTLGVRRQAETLPLMVLSSREPASQSVRSTLPLTDVTHREDVATRAVRSVAPLVLMTVRASHKMSRKVMRPLMVFTQSWRSGLFCPSTHSFPLTALSSSRSFTPQEQCTLPLTT